MTPGGSLHYCISEMERKNESYFMTEHEQRPSSHQ